MEGVSVTHWVGCPVRHQARFQGRPLAECVEDHRLFALPGPALPELETGETDLQGTEPVYQVLLDVSQFRPEDILIQVWEGWLLVKAQHGARMDEHGFVSRSFIRQYPLPGTLQGAGDPLPGTLQGAGDPLPGTLQGAGDPLPGTQPRAGHLTALLCHDGILVVRSRERAAAAQ